MDTVRKRKNSKYFCSLKQLPVTETIPYSNFVSLNLFVLASQLLGTDIADLHWKRTVKTFSYVSRRLVYTLQCVSGVEMPTQDMFLGKL